MLNNADKRSLVELTKEFKHSPAKAADATLEAKDLSHGTATITNLGTFGVDYFNPILNSPESVILGIGRIRQRDGGSATVWLSLTSTTVWRTAPTRPACSTTSRVPSPIRRS